MWRFYRLRFGEIPAALQTAVDLWVTIGTIILFIIAVLNRKVGERIMNSWHGLSPWWSLIPVGAFFLYAMARSNYERFEALTQELAKWKPPDLTAKAAELLVLIYEGQLEGFGNIIVSPTSFPPLLTAGRLTIFNCDPLDWVQYIEAVDELCKNGWTRRDPSAPDYYEPTAKGLSRGKEIFDSAQGKGVLDRLHTRFAPS